MKPKPPVALWRWGTWYATLAVALVVFYVLFMPLWFGLRALAWAAEFRERRRDGGLAVARSGESPDA